MPRLILSTCGTSLFTNRQDHEERTLVNKYSNEKTLDNIPNNDRSKLEAIISDVKLKALSASFQDIIRLSAELNALVRMYQFKPFDGKDYHILLCSDTWLGEEASKIVEEYIKKNGCNSVITYRQRDLRTDNLLNFHMALSELARWVDENINPYKEKNFNVIFNLTGGFKSVHGFLQTLALFYADEVVYIFESQEELLRIPRLPVKLTTIEIVQKHFNTFRALSLGLQCSIDDLQKIPDSLLLKYEEKYTLSPYGELAWLQAKRELYSKDLYPSPHKKIVMSDKFKKDVEKLPLDRMRIVNERIDDLVKYVAFGQNLNSLAVRQLKGNPCPPSTHECNAWSDQDARRIFFHYEGETIVLDSLDKGLH